RTGTARRFRGGLSPHNTTGAPYRGRLSHTVRLFEELFPPSRWLRSAAPRLPWRAPSPVRPPRSGSVPECHRRDPRGLARRCPATCDIQPSPPPVDAYPSSGGRHTRTPPIV